MTAAAPRQFTGRHMLIWVVSFFAVIIAVNLTMAWFASATWSGLIVKNGYVASQNFNGELARARAQEALGWMAAVSHDGEGIAIRFTGPKGEPLYGLSVSGELRSPVTDKHDQRLTFNPGQNGYVSAIRLMPGVWDLQVNATGKDEETYRKTFRFQVKG